MQTARDVLLQSSRQLNRQIRDLDEALSSGDPSRDTVEALRREAQAALERLRTVQGAAGIVGETIPKVSEHLDLFVEIAGSAGTEPGLSRKLLRHLLDEQLELTALAEKEGPLAASAAAAHPAGRAGAPAPSAAPRAGGTGAAAPRARVSGAGTLPGGRRPLTVGSLIHH